MTRTHLYTDQQVVEGHRLAAEDAVLDEARCLINFAFGDLLLQFAPMGSDGTHSGAMEVVEDFASIIGVEFSRLRQCRSLAAAIPAGTRVPAASWSVHREVWRFGPEGLAILRALVATHGRVSVRMVQAALREHVAGKRRPKVADAVERVAQHRGVKSRPADEEALRGSWEEPVFSATVGDSREALRGIIRIHVAAGSVVLDPFHGTGEMWDEDYFGCVVKASDIETGIDARALPYDDNSADAAVLDPPFHPRTGPGPSMYDATYGPTPKNIEAIKVLYRNSLAEACRVVRVGGSVIVKGQDVVSQGRIHRIGSLIDGYAATLNLQDVDDFIQVKQRHQVFPADHWNQQHHAARNWSWWRIFRKR